MSETASEHNDDWDTIWDEHADANKINPAQGFRRHLAIRLLARQGAVQRLLDIGSGTGDLIEDAHKRWPDAELHGVELASVGVEISRKKVPTATFAVVDLIKTKQPPKEFAGWATHAICSEVLEHVDDPVELMRNARAWLEPACAVVVTVPGGPMSAFDKHIGHRRHFTADDIARVLTDAGYEVERASGSGFPFFNLYRRLVISRGDKLVRESATGGASVRIGTLIFKPLLWLSSGLSKRGWQTVAVARVPR